MVAKTSPITSPYNITCKSVKINKNNVISIHSTFFNALVCDTYLAFPENLPIAARCASMEIIVNLSEVRNVEFKKIF